MEKLEQEKVHEIFYACLFKEEEVKRGRPCTDFTPVKSINPKKNITVCFCTDRLNEFKEIIIGFFNLLSSKINTFNDLYYDINGNKWCEDIQTIDQLIQLGLGCNIITYNTNYDNIFINRLKENDNLIIKGHNPKELPEKKEEIVKEYTAEEKALIAKNKKLITAELKKYISTINIGLSFYGIHAKINNNSENQLDFYDIKNNLIYSRQFEDTCGILVSDFDIRLNTEFVDNYGNTIKYFLDDSHNYRHCFILSSPEKKYGYRIELTYNKNNTVLENIEVRTTNANDDYVFKRLNIDEGNLYAELNNQFGPYGNYIDGEKRKIWYISPKNIVNYPNFFMTESVLPNSTENYHQISGGLNGLSLDKTYTTGPLTCQQFNSASLNITRHPRNKETIEYILDELDKQLPGIKTFTINNFSIYSDVMNGEYESDPVLDEMINNTIQNECNIKKKERKKINY